MGTPLRGLSSFVPLLPRTLPPASRRPVASSSRDVFVDAPVTRLAPAPPPPIDVATLRPDTVATVEQAMDLEPGGLATLLGSPVFQPELKTRAALMIFELESSARIPPGFVDQVVASGQDLEEVAGKLGVSDETKAKLGQRFGESFDALSAGWAGFDDAKKGELLSALFALEHPPSVPIATIEELTKSGAGLEKVKSALQIGDESAGLILELEGAGRVPWEELPPERRMDLAAKMFRHQNLLPAYEDAGGDARLSRLKQLIDAQNGKPGFFSNLGDFALASLVNVVSDYVFFNASKWKDPSQHGGQAVSLAYRVYQVALQAYSSVWLGANHGTGTSMAFWWNQWNAGNDFGYYGVASLADALGVKPQGWDGGDWPKALFDDAHPPTWFSWTLWALEHPGAPTTGGDILDGALRSTGTTLQLLRPEANTPWRDSHGDGFWSQLGSWLSKLVPGRVF